MTDNATECPYCYSHDCPENVPTQNTMTKADWLRSEIEKLDGMKKDAGNGVDQSWWFHATTHNQAITSIITRYKEELLELEKGV